MSQVQPTSSPPPPRALPPTKGPATTWEKIRNFFVHFFNEIFHPERKYFTDEMKLKITHIKTAPHNIDATTVEDEDNLLKEAILSYISKTLKNTKQEEEIGEFYSILNKMVERVSQKQGEYEQVRREQLPLVFAELLASENPLFIALCPFLKEGKLPLDPHDAQDKLLIKRWFTWSYAIPVNDLMCHFTEKDRKISYLTDKFTRMMKQDPKAVDTFLATMPTPQSLQQLTEAGAQKSNLEKIATHLVPKIIDKLLEKIRSTEDFSPIFDDGIKLLKMHIQSIEEGNKKAEEIRNTLDELRAVLLTPDATLTAPQAELVGAVWGESEELLSKTVEQRKAFFNDPKAKKREDFYLKECRYKTMKIKGKSVVAEALQVTDSSNLVRKTIRHEKNREDYAQQDRHAIEELRHLIKSGATLTPQANTVAEMIWGSNWIEEYTNDSKVEDFIKRAPIHLKPSTPARSVTASPKKTPRSSSPTSPSRPPTPWNWLILSNEIEPLTDKRTNELSEFCKKTWGMDFETLVKLPDIDREYIFREAAYKAYVKDKMAGEIAALANSPIQEMLTPQFLDELIADMRKSDLGPIKGLLADENLVGALKALLPAFVTNGVKLGLKTAVADLLLESHQLKRLVDDILPESIVTVHTVLLKNLLQRRLPDFADALLDSGKKGKLLGEIKHQYEGLVATELQEKPPFETDTVLSAVFATLQADLGSVINEIQGNNTLSDSGRRNLMVEAMQYYLEALPGENQSVYSELVSLAALDIAELPSLKSSIANLGLGLGKLLNLDKILNQVITSSLYPYRKGTREMQRVLTKKFQRMATTDPATVVPFEIRIPYKEKPLAPVRSLEIHALRQALKTGIGINGVIPSVHDKHPELVIRFDADRKWLEDNDTKTVEEILTILGLKPYVGPLQNDSFHLPLREKMVADKMQKLVRPIILVAKVRLGIGVATSFFEAIKAFFARHLFNKIVEETSHITAINKLMKRVLFQGILYPQDAPPSQTLAATKSLSNRSIRLIESGQLTLLKGLIFASDEDQAPKATGGPDIVTDPYPTLEDPAMKGLAGILSDGIRAIIPVLLDDKIWRIQSALLLTGQASERETRELVKRLLETFDFAPPERAFFEFQATYDMRYEAFVRRVTSILMALGYEGTVEDFLELSSDDQQAIYQKLQYEAMEKLLQSETVKGLVRKLGGRLARNLVLRAGATTEARFAPMQGANRTEKLLGRLLDQLETEEGFLIARQQMRELCRTRRVERARAFQLAALLEAENLQAENLEAENLEAGNRVKRDPITQYLENNQERLGPLLRPLLLSLLPAGFIQSELEELVENGLIKVTANERLMGLLMREIPRASSPFYPLMDHLETLEEFDEIRASGDVAKFDAYFQANCKKLENLLRPFLTSFSSRENEQRDLNASIDKLYSTYKDRLFAPLPLFKRTFAGLSRSQEFCNLLKPLLAHFHFSSDVEYVTIEALYQEHLSELTESEFRNKVVANDQFAKQLNELIHSLLGEQEKGESKDLKGLTLFEKYKDKLFEPNIHVALLLGTAIRKAPDLTEKLSEILLPPLMGDFLTELRALDQKNVNLGGLLVPKMIIKGAVDEVVARAHLHLTGLLAAERRTSQAALETFKKNKTGVHPLLEKRSATDIDGGEYKNSVKAFALQLVEQIRSTFLSDAEKQKLVKLLWVRRNEVIPLLGLDPALLHDVLANETTFLPFGVTLLESLLGPERREMIAYLITEKILEKAGPEKFQRIVLSAIPPITNQLKPIVLTKLFIEHAIKDAGVAQMLYNYTQQGVGGEDLTVALLKFSQPISPDLTFTHDHILDVQKRLLQKFPLVKGTTLDGFKAKISDTVVTKDRFEERLVKNGFLGSLIYSDPLTIGMALDKFDQFAGEQLKAVRDSGGYISDGDFEAAKEEVYQAITNTTLENDPSLGTRDIILKSLDLNKPTTVVPRKLTTFVPLLQALTSKVFNTALYAPISAASRMVFNNTSIPEWINDQIIEVLTPIVYNDQPVETLSALIQPALSDVLTRDFFASSEAKPQPTFEDFENATKELAKLVELGFIPKAITNWKDVSSSLSNILAKVLFDLTDQGWKNENLIFHAISAISEQFKPT